MLTKEELPAYTMATEAVIAENIDKRNKQVDTLLEKPCYVIDFLPERVPKTSNGQFFAIEHYLLNSAKRSMIKEKFVNVILKLMCYYQVSVLWNSWIERPPPEMIDNAINEIMENHSGSLNLLFPENNTLLVFEWDCLNLSVFNPTESMKLLMNSIALSEGLFWWKACN